MSRIEVIELLHRDACLERLNQPATAGPALPDDLTWARIVATDPSPDQENLSWLCQAIEAGKLRFDEFDPAHCLLLDLRSAGDAAPALNTLDPAAESVIEALRAALDLAEIDEPGATIHHRDEGILVVQVRTPASLDHWGLGAQWPAPQADATQLIYILPNGSRYLSLPAGELLDVAGASLEWTDINQVHRNAMLGSVKLCHLAMQQYGGGLKHAPDVVLSSLCEMAVREDGWALANVPERLQSAALAACAVQQDGRTLKHVAPGLRSEAVCEMAVKQHALALESVPEELRTERLCEIAVEQRGLALRNVPMALRTSSLCWIAVENDGHALQHVPKHLITREMCDAALEQNGIAWRYIPKELRTEEQCRIAVGKSPSVLHAVPKEWRTAAVYEAAVGTNPDSIRFVPEEMLTPRLLGMASRGDPSEARQSTRPGPG